MPSGAMDMHAMPSGAMGMRAGAEGGHVYVRRVWMKYEELDPKVSGSPRLPLSLLSPVVDSHFDTFSHLSSYLAVPWDPTDPVCATVLLQTLTDKITQRNLSLQCTVISKT